MSKGEFLGMCDLTPALYLQKKEAELKLTAAPYLSPKNNRLIINQSAGGGEGSALNATFFLKDNKGDTSAQAFRFSRLNTLFGTHYVEVHIIRASGLPIAKRMSGRTDPYVLVYYNEEKQGETSNKKNTRDPIWNNEKFLVNLSVCVEKTYTTPPLYVEVWDKDFLTGGSCLGSVCIDEMLLVHPVNEEIELPLLDFNHSTHASYLEAQAKAQEAAIKASEALAKQQLLQQQQQASSTAAAGDGSSLPPPPPPTSPSRGFLSLMGGVGDMVKKARSVVGGGGGASKERGNVTIKLVSRFERQRMHFVSSDGVNEARKNSDSVLSPLALTVINDVDEEGLRQKREKSSFPNVISKAQQQMDTYIDKPFERTGLISELHYGQVISSVQRGEHTVLKTPHADILCLPTSGPPPPIALPSSTGGKAGAGAGGKMGKHASHNKHDDEEKEGEDSGPQDILYIVARYDKGKLPRRDVEFLQKFQSILMRGLAMANSRKQRQDARDVLEKSLTSLANSSRSFANEVLMQGILDIEVAFSVMLHSNTRIDVDIYSLLPSGKAWGLCSRTKGEPDYVSPLANSLVSAAAKVCRHGVMLQYYKGKISLIDMSWATVTQTSLITLDSVREKIDEVEGQDTVANIYTHMHKSFPNGAYIIPLIGGGGGAGGEVMLGLCVVKDIDELPYAVYKVRANSGHKKRRDKIGGGGLVEMVAPEEGVVHVMKEAGRLVGTALLTARAGDVIKRMGNFEVNHDTTLLEVLRNCFRLVIVAIPAIREISLWCIKLRDDDDESGVDGEVAEKIVLASASEDNLDEVGGETKKKKKKEEKPRAPPPPAAAPPLVAASSMVVAATDTAATKKKGFFSSFFGSLGWGKKNVAEGGSAGGGDGDEEGGEGEKAAVEGGRSLVFAGVAPIVAGYFGSEDPDRLIAAHTHLMAGQLKAFTKKKPMARLSEDDDEDLDDDDYGEEGGERGKSGKKQEEVVVYKRVGMRRSSVINASQVADVTGVGV